MGDEDHRRVRFTLNDTKQTQDLCLDRDIQRSRWFIGDDNARLIGDCHGNHAALPHPAGKLVRILVETFVGVGDPHVRDELYGAGPCVGFRNSPVMHTNRFDQLRADRERGMQRRRRVLKDDRDVFATHSSELSRLDLE